MFRGNQPEKEENDKSRRIARARTNLIFYYANYFGFSITTKARFDETKVQEKNPRKFAQKAAWAKANLVAKQIKGGEAIIIAADTIVVVNNSIIGKPKDDQDAFAIISRLVGKEQTVITGFCLINSKTKKKIIGAEETIVKMRLISPRAIRCYIATGESRDKAGAYAIQGRADKFIEYVIGDYYNVIGLPVKNIKEALREII